METRPSETYIIPVNWNILFYGYTVVLHEVNWCVVVWCQRCKYTPSVDIQKRAIKKLVTHAESHTGAVSLLENCIKAINNNNNWNMLIDRDIIWPWASLYPRPLPSPWGFYHMVISGYLDYQSTQFRLSASKVLLFVSVMLVLVHYPEFQIAMTLSLSNSFIMTKKTFSKDYFIVRTVEYVVAFRFYLS